ncbi:MULTISPECIES: NADP-dependent oxidoreductase [Bacillus]|uniref:NADP-dependent oxidoreductase n=1 Tax=Bacillus TaxID=1386 RepID=UPI0007F8C9A5|nr:NADP-dependent oxidoreductase [Bacillus velezensis]ASB52122.1 Putative NADP-dependent oxidoreductase YfmJ [Bacillus velezensis]MCG1016739.1 NADP-dependent oxidoreductase [Bacillus velezensis]MCR6608283.1 NADP-dependent oxidoreductase [Bacillus velezensis]MEC0446436.1 NADP-dependent oxidoreductase [Bacillus velezensis]OBR31703.1 Putative NADP-dependent oxidoreductase YfmJ [Bacillus velezensis]
MPNNQQQIQLARRPKGVPAHDDFRFETIAVPEPKDGEVLVKTSYVSVDPYMRGRMQDTKSYVEPFALDEAITGGVIAEVLTDGDQLKKGDVVIGNLAWQEYSAVNESALRKLDTDIAPAQAYLGILGMTGLTAYFGLLDIGRPKKGETVVVSGAAGAVGSTVGQIAKIKGARVVGIAGSDEKIAYLKEELQFDEAINYKTADDIQKALMQGFIVSDYADRFSEGAKQLAEWLKDGKLHYEETITEGFSNIPDAFLGLFKGENKGKQIIKVSDLS